MEQNFLDRTQNNFDCTNNTLNCDKNTPDIFKVSPAAWLYWKELTHVPAGTQNPLIKCAMKWAIKMQQEMDRTKSPCLTRQIAYDTFDELVKIEGKIPVTRSIPLLIRVWQYGAELGTAYNYDPAVIEKLKKYASNANIGQRQAESENKDPFLSRQRAENYYAKQHNEKARHDFEKEKELLASYNDITVEFNSPKANEALGSLTPREQTTALLFMKAAQSLMAERANLCTKRPMTMEGEFIEKAKAVLYCKMTPAAYKFIVQYWTFGRDLLTYHDNLSRSPAPGLLRQAIAKEHI